jgi:K+-sensing histidine kinase KdpD
MNPYGTGMGLNICQSMLKAIGCNIVLEHSTVQKPFNGSIFAFSIHNQPE